MKKILISLVIICASFVAHSQNVKQDKSGNYYAIGRNDSTQAKQTGNTYTDSKGIVYPVYISKKGKLFVIRTSKTGNKYNYYLKS